jgi:hypothetical protein
MFDRLSYLKQFYKNIYYIMIFITKESWIINSNFTYLN